MVRWHLFTSWRVGRENIRVQDVPRTETIGKKKILFTKIDIKKEENVPRQAACRKRDRQRSLKLWEEVQEKMEKTEQPQERSIVQALSSIATLFRLKQSGQMAVPEPGNKDLYGLAVLALMEDNNLSSFTAGLAAFLAIYDISKVPPAMIPEVESRLLEMFRVVWLSCMKIGQETVSEGEKKLLGEAFGLMLRGLLQQCATTPHIIFILKHFEEHGWECFSYAWDQLLFCAAHQSTINICSKLRIGR
ncbi:uncharacterized protein LOC131204986 [Ahaetulla prasina]|uniref:uncharacterized protein LOC131204986 n=1 Tax=Ahaetulla prasina TaxID=499056 RepID=UPI002648F807|nr:uncharacterized protein LOC131204986 [Ahaetulla prasina]